MVFVYVDAMHARVHTFIHTDNKQAKKHFLFKRGGVFEADPAPQEQAK